VLDHVCPVALVSGVETLGSESASHLHSVLGAELVRIQDGADPGGQDIMQFREVPPEEQPDSRFISGTGEADVTFVVGLSADLTQSFAQRRSVKCSVGFTRQAGYQR
jgi:hypothetical protein